jgi:hypothetical protein
MRYAHYQCHDALGDIQINNAISALITVCTCICFLLFCTCLFFLLSFILYITPAVRRRGLVFLSLRWSPWLRCTESLSTHRRFTTSRLISIFMGCSSIGSCGANGNTFDRKKGETIEGLPWIEQRKKRKEPALAGRENKRGRESST